MLVVLTFGTQSEAAVDFEKQVLPIFEHACFKCHSELTKNPKGDLKLDEAVAISNATQSGGSIVPGKPDESELVRMIELAASDDDAMPPAKENKPLSDAQKTTIRQWVAEGANTGTWLAYKHKKQERLSLTAEAARDVKAAAAAIDKIVMETLQKSGDEPAAPAGEEILLRRIYLDLVGRNPTFEEASAYLDSSDPAKRAKLIDQLLASEGYVSRAFNYWADALRAKTEMPRTPGEPYLVWLKEVLRQNKPYDQIVREMLRAEGRFWKNPATGYYFRDETNRLAGVEATSSLFLGADIGCAQCHDDPYDKWTQKGFYEFASFMTGATTEVPIEKTLPHVDSQAVDKHRLDLYNYNHSLIAARNAEKDGDTTARAKVKIPELAGVSEPLRERMLEAAEKMHRFREIKYHAFAGGVRKDLQPPEKNYTPRLPGTFRAKDGKPGMEIQPAVLIGETPQVENPHDLPKVLASWLTSPENPRFALVASNRLWKWMMGASLCGPVNDLVDESQFASPALVQHLEALMIATGYDLKQFLRILANTEAYGRMAVAVTVDDTQPKLYPGPILRRLSAEEIWDSLVVMIDGEADSKLRKDQPDYSFLEKMVAAKNIDDYWMTLLDEAQVQEGMKIDFYGGRLVLSSLYKDQEAKKRDGGIKRASEVDSPAPDGHFLRIFGQSDRELMDNSWSNPTTPQTLTLMNGPLFEKIADSGSTLQRSVASAQSHEGKTRAVFLSVLGRSPTSSELGMVLDLLRDGEQVRYDDLAWTLINSNEFLFKY
jgi:hypothetical protein